LADLRFSALSAMVASITKPLASPDHHKGANDQQLP
jgi:hypothetical protein